jgi:hypothetical protein
MTLGNSGGNFVMTTFSFKCDCGCSLSLTLNDSAISVGFKEDK